MDVVVGGDPGVPQGADEPGDLRPVPPLCVAPGRPARERRPLLARSPEVQGQFYITFVITSH